MRGGGHDLSLWGLGECRVYLPTVETRQRRRFDFVHIVYAAATLAVIQMACQSNVKVFNLITKINFGYTCKRC